MQIRKRRGRGDIETLLNLNNLALRLLVKGRLSQKESLDLIGLDNIKGLLTSFQLPAK